MKQLHLLPFEWIMFPNKQWGKELSGVGLGALLQDNPNEESGTSVG